MAGEFRPLHDVLRELKPLVQRKASGFFFVVTEDNHSCTIRLRNGDIDDVLFSRQRNDDAVQLLSTVNSAKARFQPMAVSGASKGALSQASIKWLLGDFENVPPMATQAVVADSASVILPKAGVSDAQRQAVEKIALDYFGPIASLLCDEAFVADNTIDEALVQIASNLSTQGESQRFMAAARGALARIV